MKFSLLFLINVYQLILSPVLRQLFGVKCRYSLSCTAYAKQTIEKYGVIAGSQLAIKRFLRCQPFVQTYEPIL